MISRAVSQARRRCRRRRRWRSARCPPLRSSGKKQLVRIVEFDASGVRTGVVEVEKVEKPEAEWKKQLTAEQFEVTRQAGTEYPRHRQVRQQSRRWPVSLHLLQYGSLRFQNQVRIRHRLAQFLAADREGKCQSTGGQFAWDAKRRGSVQPAAMPIWGMFLTTVRRPRTCAIA